MKNDFFTYSRRKIEKDKAAGRCDVANNRGAALKCLSKFLDKEELTFGELSPEMMTQFKEWLKSNGRKESTVRLLTSSLKKHLFYNWLINNILYLCVT